MPKNLRHVAVVASTTMGSRILGLVRDILIFSFLGASLFNSAFLVAFTIPNLFRRLLGEGALTSAFIPVLADEMEAGGVNRGFEFLNRVLSRLFLALLLITGLGVGLSWGIRFLQNLPPRWYLVGELNLILLPYMIFICLAAILGACLNVRQRFAIPALSPVLLNLSMIFFLGVLAYLFTDTAAEATVFLSVGVLVGGLLQLLFPAWALIREGWRPGWDRSSDTAVNQLWVLLMPGLAGAAVLQVNILVGRVLAFSLEESAVALLYLASRLIELPLGVFSVAVVTVAFPQMARLASAGDREGYGEAFREGFRLILAISIPAAVGLIVLAFPILDSLFRYGTFTVDDVRATVPLLVIYAVGLPFYSLATYLVRGLHSRKDMKTPLRIAVVALFLNLGLSLLFMFPLGAAGLALANVLATLVQTLLLLKTMQGSYPEIQLLQIGRSLVTILLGSLVMGALCWGGYQGLQPLGLSLRQESVLSLLLLIPLGSGAYFFLLYLLQFEDLGEWTRLLAKPLSKSKRNPPK